MATLSPRVGKGGANLDVVALSHPPATSSLSLLLSLDHTHAGRVSHQSSLQHVTFSRRVKNALLCPLRHHHGPVPILQCHLFPPGPFFLFWGCVYPIFKLEDKF